MPSSPPHEPSAKQQVQAYLRRLPATESADFVGGTNEDVLVFRSVHHLAAFAFAGPDPVSAFQETYESFKKLYHENQAQWDTLDITYVLCVPADCKNLHQVSSRIETDTYFCRKFVVPLATPIGNALARLPFLPLNTLEGPSLRPSSAQTFLRACGVSADLARAIVVQHARAAKGIIEDCLAGLHGEPSSLKRAQTMTEVQVDASVPPVLLRRITVENFRAYRKPKTFDIGEDVTVLYGPNGFGKTSLFDAIDFVVTGAIGRLDSSNETRLRKLAAHLDTPDYRKSSVTMQFSDADVLHTIYRTVEHPKQATLNQVSEEREKILRRLTAGGQAVADRVDNLISLFRATHLFSQDSQELAKDFGEKCTLSSTIVSRMLAFEDYANAVNKSAEVVGILSGQATQFSKDVTTNTALLKQARMDLNRLRKTTKDIQSIGSLSAEIAVLRTELTNMSIDIPGDQADAAMVRGWRATIKGRQSDTSARRERVVELAKEVAALPANAKEASELQSRIEEAESRKKSASERRDTLTQSQQRLQREATAWNAEFSEAQLRLDNLNWLRASKTPYDNAVEAERNATTALDAASKATAVARAEEMRIAVELEPKRASVQASSDRIVHLRSRLAATSQLQSRLGRWREASSRLQDVRTLIPAQQAELANLSGLEAAERQLVEANAVEQQRLSMLIAGVDRSQSDLKRLLSQLQLHVADGTCPLCGEDHGSKDNLVGRISRQLSIDSASDARAALANLRLVGQTHSQQLEAHRAAHRTVQQHLAGLQEEDTSLTGEINGYARSAADLGIAVGSSFPELIRAVEGNLSTVHAELSQETERGRVLSTETETARTSRETANAALNAAVARESSIKQSLDTIRKQLSTLRNDPRAANPTLDITVPALSSLIEAASAKLEELRTVQANRTQRNATLQQQIEAAIREEAKAHNDLTPLATRLAALQQHKASVAGRLKDAGLPEDATDAELNDHLIAITASQAHLQALHARLSSIEIGLDAVTTAAALSRLRDHVDQLEKALAASKKSRADLKPWQMYFSEIKKFVESEQRAAIDNFTKQYGPRTSIIQRRLRSVYGFDDIRISSGSKSDIRVTVERNGEEFRPIDYFSQSQQQTLLLGLFLTACSSQNWSSFSPILLDDPVTHFDDLNTYALLDLVLGLLRSDMGRRQFIISTCDEKLLQLAQQKFAHLGERVVYYRFTSISEDGPEVERIPHGYS